MRPAIYGTVGILAGVIAAIPYRGAHEPLLDFALRWYYLPVGVVVIIAVILGQLRHRSETYIYLSSALLFICGIVQLRYFVIALMYRDIAAIFGTISAGFLFAAGITVLKYQSGHSQNSGSTPI